MAATLAATKTKTKRENKRILDKVRAIKALARKKEKKKKIKLRIPSHLYDDWRALTKNYDTKKFEISFTGACKVLNIGPHGFSSIWQMALSDKEDPAPWLTALFEAGCGSEDMKYHDPQYQKRQMNLLLEWIAICKRTNHKFDPFQAVPSATSSYHDVVSLLSSNDSDGGDDGHADDCEVPARSRVDPV